MSRLCRFFVIFIAAYTAVSCFSPIGGSGFDLFWVVPNRLSYNAGDSFMPKDDLQAFTSYQGVVEAVPVEKVKISIAEDADKPDELKNIPSDKGYLLKTAGRKIVVLKYDEMLTRYSFEVTGTYKEGTGAGIIIKWAE